MPDFNGLRLNLNTVVLIVTMVAGFGGTWAVMGERIKNTAALTMKLEERVDSLSAAVNASERDQILLTERFNNLREIVMELRRHSGLPLTATPTSQP